jgi:hypothetical protein
LGRKIVLISEIASNFDAALVNSSFVPEETKQRTEAHEGHRGIEQIRTLPGKQASKRNQNVLNYTQESALNPPPLRERVTR